MAYNWQKHIKKPKTDDDFVHYVVNTNTNIIYKFGQNPHYKSTRDCRADGDKQNKIQKRRRQYVKVRADQTLDYKKTAPCSRVHKWISQNYVISCNNYNMALYSQALIRMDKSDGDTKEMWRGIAEKIQDKHPEDLI